MEQGKEQNWQLCVVFLFFFIPQSALCFVLCSSDLVPSPWLCCSLAGLCWDGFGWTVGCVKLKPFLLQLPEPESGACCVHTSPGPEALTVLKLFWSVFFPMDCTLNCSPGKDTCFWRSTVITRVAKNLKEEEGLLKGKEKQK